MKYRTQFLEETRKNWGIIFSVIFILICLIYVLWNEDNIYVPVHDNLDAGVAWLKMMKDNHLFFTYHSAKLPFVGGLDRNYLYSNIKVYTWFYIMLPTFAAHVVAWFAHVVLSILGFRYLGKTLYGKEFCEYQNFITILGLIYGILPFMCTIVMGFSYLPFLVAFLIQLYRKPSRKYLAGIAAYALFSDFVYFGIFTCGYILAFFIIDWIAKKRAKWSFLVALIFLSLAYGISEWRLFFVLFAGDQTIRETMVSSSYSLREVLKEIQTYFHAGQYHGGSLHTKLILPVCMVYCITLNIRYIVEKRWRNIFSDYFNWAFLLICFNSTVAGLEDYETFKSTISAIVPILKGFNFSRTLLFNPFLWYFIFGIVLCRIIRNRSSFYLILASLLCALSIFIVCTTPSTYNCIQSNIELQKDRQRNGVSELLSYKEFYSSSLFDSIKDEIGYNDEWCIAFGMHPAILEYNGIATLDGYISYYPQTYKEYFRTLISPDLNIDEANRNYFDTWGGRAYIFSNEIAFQPVRDMGVTEADMHIDTKVFDDMGGKYIFSRVAIKNSSELGIILKGVFDMEGSPYIIYVYAR
jgi:hypothetical protein